MFSIADIFRIININTARYLHMEDQIGSIEPGKLAGIILLDGDPRENIYGMLKTKGVMRSGKVVVDKAASPDPRQKNSTRSRVFTVW